jgi:hypothetical protein
VGVEVDDAHLTAPDGSGDGRGGGQRDRVVATEDDGDGAQGGNLGHLRADGLVGALDATGDDGGVAVIEDAQDLQGLDAEREMVDAAAQVRGLADGAGAVAGAGTVRDPHIEGRADDDGGGPLGRELLRRGDVWQLEEGWDAHKGRVRGHAVEDHGTSIGHPGHGFGAECPPIPNEMRPCGG